MGMLAETEVEGRVKEYCKDYGTWRVVFFGASLLFVFFCFCFVPLVYWVGLLGLKLSSWRGGHEMLINSNRSIFFSIMLDTKGDSLFSE